MKKLNFKPFNQDVVVLIPQVINKTLAGVLKSDEMIKEEQSKMDKFLEVVATADGCVQTKVGDKILLGRANHPSFEQDGEIYLIVNELHILGKKLWETPVKENHLLNLK